MKIRAKTIEIGPGNYIKTLSSYTILSRGYLSLYDVWYKNKNLIEKSNSFVNSEVYEYLNHV